MNQMNNRSESYEWVGWVIAAIVGIVFVLYIFNSNADKSDSTQNNVNSSETATEPATLSEPSQTESSWSCVDATSYNQNAYDDNRCTDGNETRYVSDSQAEELDPDYSPGKAGASYYNSR